jgi:protein TonB
MSLPEPEPAPPPTPAPQPEGDNGDQGNGNPDGAIEGDGGAVGAQVLGVSKPKYPSLSRRRSEEGRVVLAVEIRADGTHGSIEIVHSSGHSRLDQAAVQALKRGKFVPAREAGQPVTSTKRVAFTFRLVDAGG